jgi:hypothetical protein
MAPSNQTRPAFTRRDLTVLTVLCLLLCPLFLPAAQKAKQNADKLKCSNNLKTLILGLHNCHDTYGLLPPIVGDFPPDKHGHGTILFHLLPYFDQNELYKSSEGEKDHFSIWNNGVYSKVVDLFLCPADTSGGKDNRYEGWLALSSYGANFQVFGDPVNNTMQGSSRIASVTDGLSNTIFFAERYQICNGTPNGWGYAGESSQAPAFGYLNLDLFQPQPAQKDCDPALTQSNHPGGIVVGLGDGSVRTINLNLSPDTWWKAIIPNDGLPMGNDW